MMKSQKYFMDLKQKKSVTTWADSFTLWRQVGDENVLSDEWEMKKHP